ncbi:MAG TPA: tetratricopeptide repeat protein, partial [Prolixibacteraceae bacterium]|nr:tetratricopeptide repeat protein [Prolixibacteraceae bacterium]
MTKILLISILSLLPYFSLAQEIDQLILNNEYDKALQIIDNELIVNEAQPMLYLKKGIIQQKRFDFVGAVATLEKAYELDSINPNILSEIAEANSNLGDHRRALPYLKSLYNTDTTNTVKTLKLVRGYLNLRIYKEPFEILTSSFQRDSTNLLVNKQFALCAARTGHDDLAISLYQKVINRNPSDLANYTNLVSVYQNQDQNFKAIETLEKGLEVFPDESILLNRLGDFQYQQQEYAKAIIPYEKYLAK